jgi:hypothetical protein
MTSINSAEAKRFLGYFGCEQNFTFQTFADKKVDAQAAAHAAAAEGRKVVGLIRQFSGTFTQHATQLAELNLAGAGIFFTVNETDGTGRKSGNIIRVRAIFVDLDGSPLDPVMAHSTPPSITVESSPNRYHAYWLTDDCPLDQFKTAQQRLAHQFNGDPKVCDLPRVMRLPGFIHQKAEHFMTRIIFPE